MGSKRCEEIKVLANKCYMATLWKRALAEPLPTKELDIQDELMEQRGELVDLMSIVLAEPELNQNSSGRLPPK